MDERAVEVACESLVVRRRGESHNTGHAILDRGIDRRGKRCSQWIVWRGRRDRNGAGHDVLHENGHQTGGRPFAGGDYPDGDHGQLQTFPNGKCGLAGGADAGADSDSRQLRGGVVDEID